MGFFDNWLERAIRERMPATLGSDHFVDALGELGPAYTADRGKTMRDPVEGWMHVVGCTASNPGATRAPCHITYVVQAEGVGLFSGDQVFESHGVKLFVDPISVRYLKGAEVDFVDTVTGGGFTIKNPQATSTCGCGQSFSVD